VKIDEGLPSCFQNMTRLTDLFLLNVRGKNTDPFPFPTQFCNMIYLQRIFVGFNNFSGCERREYILLTCSISLLGPIPHGLTRLVLLKRLDLAHEPLLTGFIERRIGFIFIFWF